MAELTTLEEKLAEVTGLAKAAQEATTSPIVPIQVLITRHETIFTAPKFAAMSLITRARRSG